jgi:hypothetical protein
MEGRGSNISAEAQPDDSPASPRNLHEGFKLLFCLAGQVAADGLPRHVATLAAAIHARSADWYAYDLKELLGTGWAESIGSVAVWFSKIERWYRSEYAGGKKAILFEGGPGSCRSLTGTGQAFWERLKQEREAALRTPRAALSLADLFRDPDSHVRCAAAAALGWAGPEAERVLTHVAATDPDPRVREAASWALANYANAFGESRAAVDQAMRPDANAISDYAKGFSAISEARDRFVSSAAEHFAPVFNRELLKRWQKLKAVTPESRQKLVAWIDAQLDALGLALLDPQTMRPASLRSTATGEWRLVPTGSTNASKSRTELQELMPFALTIARARRRQK